MRSFIRSHLSYANVTATMALFVALGGVGYAAATLPRNSVGTAQIKKDAVTGAKVKNSSLTGSDIKNKSLSAADFTGSVQGPQGPQGIQGPKGDPGPPGADATRLWGVIDVEYIPPSVILSHGRGVVAVERLQEGRVRVRFDRDIRECAIQVTVLSDAGGVYSAQIDTQVAVRPFDPPTDVVVVTRVIDSGTDIGVEWSIAAFC